MNHLTPFNLERALAGDLVITRDGRPVTQLHKFNVTDGHPLGGVLGVGIAHWDEHGRYFGFSDSNADLFMAPQPKKRIRGWVNVYRCIDGHITAGIIFPERDIADKTANHVDKRIACIKIDVEEGHGL